MTRVLTGCSRALQFHKMAPKIVEISSTQRDSERDSVEWWVGFFLPHTGRVLHDPPSLLFTQVLVPGTSTGIFGSAHFSFIFCRDRTTTKKQHTHSYKSTHFHQQTNKTFNILMVKQIVRSVFFLILSIVVVSATKPTSGTKAMFGIRAASEHAESASEQGPQHIELRGGSSHQRGGWGILNEVKKDLFYLAAQPGEEANHRCSSEEVFHECVINYGSVMLGRF